MKKTKPPTIDERIQAHLDAGRTYRAYNVAVGGMGGKPYDEARYLQIGRLLLELGEPARAGLYFMMTSEESPRTMAAIDAAVAHYGPRLRKWVPIYVKPATLPWVIMERINAILKRAGAEPIRQGDKIKWKRKIPRRTPTVEGLLQVAIQAGCALAVILMIVGALTVWSSLAKAFGW
ncbi:MAG: hypothetical protein K1X53_18090 [Candidatus Sumerlaeaceae bacterium]|nr:hypothetical protein [Candidatus Sumerlaeaceae bacterium]